MNMENEMAANEPMKPHRTVDTVYMENGQEAPLPVCVAMVHPASSESVALVMSRPISIDGRSEFVWVRLPNGDLILGVFPRGETYMAVEEDAAFPL